MGFGLRNNAGWYCQRPIGDTAPKTSGPPVWNHQYICVTQIGASIFCGGLTPVGDSFLRYFGSEGRLTRPDEDFYDPKLCKEIDDDKDNCFERCVVRNFVKSVKPWYNIGPGTDCQEYADDLRYGCKILCNMTGGK